MSSSSFPSGAPLFLLPHPDDEVLGCGAAIAAHGERGDRISVLTVFDGALGNARGIREPELIAQREAELVSSLSVLAPDGELARWSWNLPEGHPPSKRDYLWAEHRLVRLLVQEPISVLYVPWAGDDHPDHQVVSRVARRALATMGHGAPVLRTYEVWSSMPRGESVPLDGDCLATLMEALACHKSQLQGGHLMRRFMERTRSRAPKGAFHGQVYGRDLDLILDAVHRGERAA